MRVKYIIMSEVTFKLKDSDFLNDYLQRPSVQIHRSVFTRKKFSDIEERTLGIGMFMSWSWHCPGKVASILCSLFLNLLNEAIRLHLHFSRSSKNCLCNSASGVSSVQSFSRVRLLATPWTATRQASLSIANSRSLLKLMSIQSVMPSNHLILCCPLLVLPSIFPSIRVFSNESVLCIRWPKYWSFSFRSVLPMNIQDWSPFGWTGWISLQSKEFSRVFSNTRDRFQKRGMSIKFGQDIYLLLNCGVGE